MNFYDEQRPSFQIYTRQHSIAAELLADGEGVYGWGYEMGRHDAKAGLDVPADLPGDYAEGYADGHHDFAKVAK